MIVLGRRARHTLDHSVSRVADRDAPIRRHVGDLVTIAAIRHRVTGVITIRAGIFLALRCGHYHSPQALSPARSSDLDCPACAYLDREDAASTPGT